MHIVTFFLETSEFSPACELSADGVTLVNEYDAEDIDYFNTKPERRSEVIQFLQDILFLALDELSPDAVKSISVTNGIVTTYVFQDSQTEAVRSVISEFANLHLDPSQNFFDSVANMMESTDGLTLEDCTRILANLTKTVPSIPTLRI